MAKVINEPTRDGFEHGYYMARFVDQEEAKGKLANGSERCATCAFRQGTYPNGCVTSQMDALKCVVQGDVFRCHEEDKPCAGWALLRRGKETPDTEVGWKFSDEYATEPKGASK